MGDEYLKIFDRHGKEVEVGLHETLQRIATWLKEQGRTEASAPATEWEWITFKIEAMAKQ